MEINVTCTGLNLENDAIKIRLLVEKCFKNALQ